MFAAECFMGSLLRAISFVMLNFHIKSRLSSTGDVKSRKTITLVTLYTCSNSFSAYRTYLRFKKKWQNMYFKNKPVSIGRSGFFQFLRSVPCIQGLRYVPANIDFTAATTTILFLTSGIHKAQSKCAQPFVVVCFNAPPGEEQKMHPYKVVFMPS
jgi:hypothetical protein